MALRFFSESRWLSGCSILANLNRKPPSHNEGGRRKELARSCRCGGDDPTHALPPRRRAVTQSSQLGTPPARGGHATKCPESSGAPCLFFLRSSPIESLALVSAPPVCRSVARLAKLRAPEEDVRVRVEAGRSDFLPYGAPRDALRGEHVVQERLTFLARPNSPPPRTISACFFAWRWK
jgi:hypothetical protein